MLISAVNVIVCPCIGDLLFMSRDKSNALAGPAIIKSRIITAEASQEAFLFFIAMTTALLTQITRECLGFILLL